MTAIIPLTRGSSKQVFAEVTSSEFPLTENFLNQEIGEDIIDALRAWSSKRKEEMPGIIEWTTRLHSGVPLGDALQESAPYGSAGSFILRMAFQRAFTEPSLIDGCFVGNLVDIHSINEVEENIEKAKEIEEASEGLIHIRRVMFARLNLARGYPTAIMIPKFVMEFKTPVRVNEYADILAHQKGLQVRDVVKKTGYNLMSISQSPSDAELKPVFKAGRLKRFGEWDDFIDFVTDKGEYFSIASVNKTHSKQRVYYFLTNDLELIANSAIRTLPDTLSNLVAKKKLKPRDPRVLHLKRIAQAASKAFQGFDDVAGAKVSDAIEILAAYDPDGQIFQSAYCDESKIHILGKDDIKRSSTYAGESFGVVLLTNHDHDSRNRFFADFLMEKKIKNSGAEKIGADWVRIVKIDNPEDPVSVKRAFQEISDIHQEMGTKFVIVPSLAPRYGSELNKNGNLTTAGAPGQINDSLVRMQAIISGYGYQGASVVITNEGMSKGTNIKLPLLRTGIHAKAGVAKMVLPYDFPYDIVVGVDVSRKGGYGATIVHALTKDGSLMNASARTSTNERRDEDEIARLILEMVSGKKIERMLFLRDGNMFESASAVVAHLKDAYPNLKVDAFEVLKKNIPVRLEYGSDDKLGFHYAVGNEVRFGLGARAGTDSGRNAPVYANIAHQVFGDPLPVDEVGEIMLALCRMNDSLDRNIVSIPAPIHIADRASNYITKRFLDKNSIGVRSFVNRHYGSDQVQGFDTPDAGQIILDKLRRYMRLPHGWTVGM